MISKHRVTLLIDKSVGEDTGRNALVDRILRTYPDAMVSGPAVVADLGRRLSVTQEFETASFRP